MTAPRGEGADGGGAGAGIGLDGGGNVAGDVTCRRCGYALRGLTPQGRCPECRAPIERSLRGDLLAHCDPSWVERLARGAAWIVASILVLLGGLAILIAALLATSAAGRPPATLARYGFPMVSFVHVLMFVCGAWLLTSPDPGAPADRGRRLRASARAAMLAYAVTPLFGAVGAALPAVTFAVPVLVLVKGLLRIACIVAGGAWFAELGRRMASPLEARARHCVWGLVVAALAATMQDIITAATGQPVGTIAGPGPDRAFIMFIGAGAVFLGAIYGLAAIILLFAFCGELRAAARGSRAAWTPDAAP